MQILVGSVGDVYRMILTFLQEYGSNDLMNNALDLMFRELIFFGSAFRGLPLSLFERDRGSSPAHNNL
jgi:hypothetical protein